MEPDNNALSDSLTFRKPTLDDGLAIYELIKRSPPLDLNSSYLYFLQADQFSDTCVVAEHNGKVVGFVSAYFKPKDSSDLFVWQVAVDASMRGQRLGSRLIERLVLNQLEQPQFAKISATISPSNIASQKLFKRFAEEHRLSIDKQIYLEESHFRGLGHEAEDMYTLSTPEFQPFTHYLIKH